MTNERRRRRAHARASLLLSLLLPACDPEPASRAPEADDERTSYAVGLHLGTRLRAMEAGLAADRIVMGFADGLAPSGEALDAEQIRLELAGVAAAARKRGPDDAAVRRNQAAGADFLAANRTRPGVVELPSGIQYRVVAAGHEPPPALADRITVEYEGRLLDGAVFDTSKDRFAPTIVRLARTPRPWREVLPLVEGGATVELWVPGSLDPTEHPVGLVPPGELVVFTLRVTSIDRHPHPDVARASP